MVDTLLVILFYWGTDVLNMLANDIPAGYAYFVEEFIYLKIEKSFYVFLLGYLRSLLF